MMEVSAVTDMENLMHVSIFRKNEIRTTNYYQIQSKEIKFFQKVSDVEQLKFLVGSVLAWNTKHYKVPFC